MLIIALIVLAIISALFVVWTRSEKKNFSILQNKAAEAKTLLNDKLNMRYAALLDLLRESEDFISENISKMAERAQIQPDMTIEELNASAYFMDKLSENISTLSEVYPSIKDNSSFFNLTDSISQIECDLSALGSTYNKYADSHNSMLTRFPTSYLGKSVAPLVLFKH